MNQQQPNQSRVHPPSSNCGATGSPQSSVQEPENAQEFAVTQWNDPVIGVDSQGNQYKLVWLPPVHPECRVIDPPKVGKLLRWLRDNGQIEEAKRLCEALDRCLPFAKANVWHELRRN